MTSRGLFQPQPLCDSVILNPAGLILERCDKMLYFDLLFTVFYNSLMGMNTNVILTRDAKRMSFFL